MPLEGRLVAAARVGVPAREDAELVTDGVTGMAQVGAAAGAGGGSAEAGTRGRGRTRSSSRRRRQQLRRRRREGLGGDLDSGGRDSEG
uniref:Uncharacterized protein n=1 Tax=Triticum urartu TaxID=4572 RepID=A0A8R7UQ41_TRIUA